MAIDGELTNPTLPVNATSAVRFRVTPLTVVPGEGDAAIALDVTTGRAIADAVSMTLKSVRDSSVSINGAIAIFIFALFVIGAGRSTAACDE
jgi:hypothetical protein